MSFIENGKNWDLKYNIHIISLCSDKLKDIKEINKIFMNDWCKYAGLVRVE